MLKVKKSFSRYLLWLGFIFLLLNNTAKGVNSAVIMESGVVVTTGLGFVFTEVSIGGCI